MLVEIIILVLVVLVVSCMLMVDTKKTVVVVDEATLREEERLKERRKLQREWVRVKRRIFPTNQYLLNVRDANMYANNLMDTLFNDVCPHKKHEYGVHIIMTDISKYILKNSNEGNIDPKDITGILDDWVLSL